LVAKYEAAKEMDFFVSPTWGRHDGPLTLHSVTGGAGGGVAEAMVTRWQVPTNATGQLTAQDTIVNVNISSNPVFLGAQAVDLPFGNWTAVSWTGQFGSTDGEIIMLDGVNPASRYPVVGIWGVVGLDGGSGTGRVLHTSLTALNDAAGTQTPGVYAADFGSGPTFSAAVTVATWGDATGAIATDQDGNVFAIQTSYTNGDQSLRGFAATKVAPQAGPAAGDALWTIAGYGTELAAVSPDGASSGLVFYQPFDSSSYEALNVVVQPYSATTNQITAAGSHSDGLTMTNTNTATKLMTDDDGRLWVGIGTATGVTTFFVLDRSP